MQNMQNFYAHIRDRALPFFL